MFALLAIFCIEETEYFNGEDDVVIPKHIVETYGTQGVVSNETTEERILSKEAQ